jgi:hypothetical protein
MTKGQTMPKTDHQEQVDDVIKVGSSEVHSRVASIAPGSTAGSLPPNQAASPPNDFICRAGSSCPRNHKLILTQKALRKIYGSEGIYDTEQNSLRKVNEWLRQIDREPVSMATLKRAKTHLARWSAEERS